ncbi:MAG: hypothetical protein JJE09_11245, partial [Bacteroidia bacterium]|nr:hypothetical protein [Bacteroidia bacterium]
LDSFDGEFYATYGMTETISHIALQRLNGEGKQNYFETLENIEISIDHRGCLVVQASNLNSEKIITNDIIEVINDKKFRWLGRWDNVINSGGVKIVPENIELIIQEIFDSLELTNRFFVAGLPDEKLTQRVALIVEGLLFTKIIKDLVEEQLKAKINTFERPKEFIFIHQFIQTNGKIKRKDTLDLIPIRPQ